jgi:D-3-phosphoglycerate dehydrogenase / 2-oxoglutarate reductase
MGMILNIDRRLAENYMLQKEGKWRKGMFTNCLGLKGRTLGLIGFGNISQRVAKRALAFEMKIVAYDVFKICMEDVEFVTSVDDVLSKSDIVSLHVPFLPSTKGMVNSEFLSKMKSDAVLINTARGELVNENDLHSHLEANENFWYGTDVLQGEPSSKECDWEHPLAKHPRMYGSHHIGASTKQAEAEIGEEAVRICQVFSNSGQIDNSNWINKDCVKYQNMENNSRTESPMKQADINEVQVK